MPRTFKIAQCGHTDSTQQQKQLKKLRKRNRTVGGLQCDQMARSFAQNLAILQQQQNGSMAFFNAKVGAKFAKFKLNSKNVAKNFKISPKNFAKDF